MGSCGGKYLKLKCKEHYLLKINENVSSNKEWRFGLLQWKVIEIKINRIWHNSLKWLSAGFDIFISNIAYRKTIEPDTKRFSC